MKKYFLLVILILLPFFIIAQGEMKGTIRVKKTPVASLKFDTVKRLEFVTFSIIPPPVVRDTTEPEYIPVTVNGITPLNPEKSFVNSIKVIPDCYKCKGSTVFTDLTFTVKKDGTLTDVEVAQEAKDCPACDAESIRIVKEMPKWKPAQYKGADIDYKWHTSITYIYAK